MPVPAADELPEAMGPQQGQSIGLPNAARYDHLNRKEQLSPEAQAILARLPMKTYKGSRRFLVYDIKGWGLSTRKAKKSSRFTSQEGLAQAIADWAAEGGDAWHLRLKLD